MILATLRDLARTLGCRPDQADDVVRSEPSARAALSRRGLFQAAGAVAAGSAFAWPAPPAISLRDAVRIAMANELVAEGWMSPFQARNFLMSFEGEWID